MAKRKFENHNLEEAFFPVMEQPVRWVDFKGNGRLIPGYKAIVERNTGRPLSVVSNKYQLVTNREAFEIADNVVSAIFEGKSLNDFICYNVLMPQSKGSCRIDMIIPNNYNKLFGDETESYTPFVRISNSYNRTATLRYEIGFCRWICLNGVIFGEMGINFSVAHTNSITNKEIDRLIVSAHNRIGTIGSLWAAFEQKMDVLKSIEIPASLALAIYCKAFDVMVEKEKLTLAQKEGLSLRAEQITKARDDYFKELGNNAYAMMNVMTDYASFPKWTKHPANFIDGYQRRVGKWVDSFIEEQKKSGFSLNGYIGNDCQKTASFLESLISAN